MKKWGSGSNYTLEIVGDEAVMRRLSELAVAYQKVVKVEMKKEGVEILEEAQNRVPVDSGALRRSGKIADGDENGSYTVAIGFGDPTVTNADGDPTSDYARYQHETHLSKAKFLEAPYFERIGTLPDRIAMKIKGVK